MQRSTRIRRRHFRRRDKEDTMAKKNEKAKNETTTAKRGDCASCGKTRKLPFSSKRYGGDVCAECHTEEVATDARFAAEANETPAETIATTDVETTKEETTTPDDFDAAFGATDNVVELRPTEEKKAKREKKPGAPSPFLLIAAYDIAKAEGKDPIPAMLAIVERIEARSRRPTLKKARTKVQAGSPVDDALKALFDKLPAETPEERARGNGSGGRGHKVCATKQGAPILYSVGVPKETGAKVGDPVSFKVMDVDGRKALVAFFG
jgi:hypothetical protein